MKLIFRVLAKLLWSYITLGGYRLARAFFILIEIGVMVAVLIASWLLSGGNVYILLGALPIALLASIPFIKLHTKMHEWMVEHPTGLESGKDAEIW